MIKKLNWLNEYHHYSKKSDAKTNPTNLTNVTNTTKLQGSASITPSLLYSNSPKRKGSVVSLR